MKLKFKTKEEAEKYLDDVMINMNFLVYGMRVKKIKDNDYGIEYKTITGRSLEESLTMYDTMENSDKFNKIIKMKRID